MANSFFLRGVESRARLQGSGGAAGAIHDQNGRLKEKTPTCQLRLQPIRSATRAQSDAKAARKHASADTASIGVNSRAPNIRSIRDSASARRHQ